MMDGMNEVFRRKLDALTVGEPITEVAKRVGIQSQTLYDAKNHGRMPRASTLLKIARAYSVPLAYLADDEWPPEPVPQSAVDVKEATDADLLREVFRRYMHYAQRVDELFQQAEAIDWDAIGARVADLVPGFDESPGKPYPPRSVRFPRDIEKALTIVAHVVNAVNNALQPFYLERWDDDEKPEDREAFDIPPDTWLLPAFYERVANIWERAQPTKEAVAYVSGWLASYHVSVDPAQAVLMLSEAIEDYRFAVERADREEQRRIDRL